MNYTNLHKSIAKDNNKNQYNIPVSISNFYVSIQLNCVTSYHNEMRRDLRKYLQHEVIANSRALKIIV